MQNSDQSQFQIALTDFFAPFRKTPPSSFEFGLWWGKLKPFGLRDITLMGGDVADIRLGPLHHRQLEVHRDGRFCAFSRSMYLSS